MKTVFASCPEKVLNTGEWEVRCVCPALEVSHDVGLECAPGAHLRFQGLGWARKCSGMICLLGTSGIHPCKEQGLPFLALLFAVSGPTSRLDSKEGWKSLCEGFALSSRENGNRERRAVLQGMGGKRILSAEVRAEPMLSLSPALWWIRVLAVVRLFSAVLSGRNPTRLTYVILHFLGATLTHKSKKKQAEFTLITYFI